MSGFALKMLCCSVVLFLEYAWKQWFGGYGTNRGRRIGLRLIQGAALMGLLVACFRFGHWMWLVASLAVIVGSTGRALDGIADALTDRGISLQWLRLLPMCGIVAATLQVIGARHLSLSGFAQSLLEQTAQSPLAGTATTVTVDGLILGASCFILLAHPANNIVKWFTASRGASSYEAQARRELALGAAEAAAQTAAGGDITLRKREGRTTDLRAGHVIGILERWIIFTLVLTQQYSLIGLVLSAKTLARFENIQKDASFGEYYLLGTLSSTFIALVLGVVMNQVMR